MKKRVLIIANSNMSNSGVPKVYMTMVRLLQHKYTFDLVIYDESDMYYQDEFLSYGGKIILFKQRKPRTLLLKLRWFLFDHKKEVIDFLNKQLDLSSYYAIHSFDENFSHYYFQEAKKKGVQFLIVHLCSAYLNYKQKLTLKKIIINHSFKKTLKYSTCIACCSSSVLRRHNYKDKGVVLRRTYNESDSNTILDCESKNLVLTQIGTFSGRKNQLFSIKVLSKIKSIIPGAVLNFVGKEIEEGYEAKMETLIKQANLQDSVFFLGTSPDKNELYRQTTFIIHPAIMEGFNNVLLEAQAVGIHCFASNTLPREPELGNAEFLKLDDSLWAEKIINVFNRLGSSRKEPTNLLLHSNNNFRDTIEKMME